MASPDTPVMLKVMEEVDAGQYSEREIQSGQAVRIMTGAAIPNAAIAVFIRRIPIMEKIS